MTPSTFKRLGIVAGSQELITLNEAKVQCRVRHNAEDTYIAELLSVAREAVEDYCKQSLIPATWRVGYSLDRLEGQWPFRGPFELCRAPVASISSVTVETISGQISLTSDKYVFDPDHARGVLRIKDSVDIADLSLDHENPVKITFTTGALSSPAYKHAVKLMLSNLFENRVPVVQGSATEVPMNIRLLLDGKKIKNSY